MTSTLLRAPRFALYCALGFLLPGDLSHGELGVNVRAEARISATSGGFGGTLDPVDRFSEGLAGIGDLDGDGIADLAVGAPSDDGLGINRGALHILFLNQDGSVRAEQELGEGTGGFPFALDDGACFGGSLAALGDINGDGTPDLAVGARDQDGLGSSRGSVFVLFLATDGTVLSGTEIGEGLGGFAGTLDDFDNFGHGLATIGDLDGDGVPELAVGATGDDDARANAGALTILFLDAAGRVKTQQKITEGSGGFNASLSTGSFFGESLAGLGDLDGDGVLDLAVGAWGDDDAGDSVGAMWTLLLMADGTVKSELKITAGAGGFNGQLLGNDAFARSLANLGDLDGDGLAEIAVGATGDDDGGSRSGALWILFLAEDGSVRFERKISAEAGQFVGPLSVGDGFGWDLALVGDINGDGKPELAVGAPQDDEGGFDSGAVWLLFLENGPDFKLGSFADESASLRAGKPVQRNGTGLNPMIFSSNTRPILGTTWDANLDTSGLGGFGLTVAGYFDNPFSGVILPAGELLVDTSAPPIFVSSAFSFGSATHLAPIPALTALMGTKISVQAVATVGTTLTLSNALDLILGS